MLIQLVSTSVVYGEFYNEGTTEEGYYEDHKTFEDTPNFCIVNNFDYYDNNDHTVSTYILNETISSINEWNDAIKIYYWHDWIDFSINVVDKFSFFHDCNAYIFFIDGDSGNTLGKAIQWGDILLIYIYYETIADITDIHYVIKHEIGHTLGLGHRSPYSTFSIMTPSIEVQKDYDKDSDFHDRRIFCLQDLRRKWILIHICILYNSFPFIITLNN